jgi:DNA-binding beta-propeller fold protein YncE
VYGFVALLCAVRLAVAVDGVIPNLAFPTNQFFKQISPQLTSLHLNQPSVYNGYLVLGGNAVHEVWDIANPYAPVFKARMTSPHAAGEAEAHQVTYGRMADGTTYFAAPSGKGIDIWNVTVTTNPVLVAAMQLPNINYGDVAGAIWGVAWEGKYIYAGATTHGLYIVDVSNPGQPQLVKTLSTTQLGGVVAGPVFALGNLLVVTTPKEHFGVATVDISDPTNPQLLDSVTGGANSYIGGFYGGNAHFLTPFRTYDVTTDPRNIQLKGSTNLVSSEYQSYGENCLFLGGLRGGTEGIWKYSITNPAKPVLIGRLAGRTNALDDQFSCPIGNLMMVDDDQLLGGIYYGGYLAVHDVNPDTSPPSVITVYPTNNAINQPLTTRIAVSLTDWPELATVNPSSFIVRPVGGEPVAGSWGCTYTVLTFAPDAPLEPRTDYEIILPAGGIRDLVGNPIAAQFESTFSTGSGVMGFPGSVDIAPVSPTELGDPTTVALLNPPGPGVVNTWNFGDGTMTNGASASHLYAAPGRYVISMNAATVANYQEAEKAQLGGGVVVASDNAGFSGTGYADFPGGTGTNVYVRWTLTNQTAGNVNLQFRYACNGAARPLNLVINRGATNFINFPGTNSWTTYLTVTYSNVSLVAGTNTIELLASAGSAGPNLDTLIIPLQSPQSTTVAFTHVVHRPLTPVYPTHSQAIAIDQSHQTVWAVNPDNNTVTAVNAVNFMKQGEYAVGQKPETLAVGPDNTVWVANRDSATISVLNTNGSHITTIQLPRASQPYGIVFSPNGSNAFVVLQALARVLKMDPLSRTITASLDLSSDANGIRPQIRGAAVNAAGDTLFVTRFVSPTNVGQVFEISVQTLTLNKTIALANDPGPDTPQSSRGIPNYLNSIAISPDGVRAWLPSKKDNLSRGVLRDGNPLTHDMTVRCMAAVFNPVTGVELLDERMDFDNKDRAHAVCFSPLGDLTFVTLPGNNVVKVVDAYSGSTVSEIPVDRAPTGVLLDPISRRLYVLNFLSRSLSGFDVSNLINGVDTVAVPLGLPVSLVTAEPLAANVLRGKQLFYDATSARLNEEGYMSCASCHLDGDSDGRVWDMTGFGEGLRNTIDLRGHGGTAQGRLHWSGNFDEVQDFEGQIRALGAGTGLLDDSSFNSGTRSQPLGFAKHGISADLDDLAAYVQSLITVPPSPYRNTDGTLTGNGLAGKAIFNQLSCYNCHGGEAFTDSSFGVMHDVGTLKASSGYRLGGSLSGLDTPTLRGVWATAPYLHDGSAATLADVLTIANPANAHGATSALTSNELNQLVAYLNQIDGSEPAALPPGNNGQMTYNAYTNSYLAAGVSGPLDNPDGDRLPNLLEYAFGNSNPTNASSMQPTIANLSGTGTNQFSFSYLRRMGGYWLNGYYHVADLGYIPQGSMDLVDWNLGVLECDNPPNLPGAPVGYEWISHKIPSLTNQPVGFGSVKIILNPPQP